MTYCHECGSEVAENDVFCPFCGISLRPIAVAGSEDEAAFESTIIMPLPEKANAASAESAQSGEIDSSGATPADDSTLPDTLEKIEGEDEELPNIELAEDEAAADESAFPTEPEIDTPEEAVAESASIPDLENVPTPKVLEELEKRAGGLFDIPSAAKEEKSGTALETESAAGSIQVSEPETSTSAETEDKADSHSKAKTAEGVVFSTADVPRDDLDVSDLYIEAEEDAAGEAEIPPVRQEFEVSVAHVYEEPGTEPPALSAESSDEPPTAAEPEPELDPMLLSRPEIYKERAKDSDQGISKPLEELEAVDRFASQSMFDSVRIMEGKPPKRKADAVSNERPVPSSGEYAPSDVPVRGTEAPSHTTPNIGIVDTTGKGTPKLKPLDEGTILNGRYEIVRKIGGGGMGAVYLASDNNLGGVLRAVKEMVQSHIEEAQQEKAINDFKRESMILSTLDHPSIPTIYDYFYDAEESRFYLVMKYVSGGDLSSRLRAAPEGRIDEKSVTEWAIQIADVLDYLHSQPTTIVYRDLKPSNIMIDGNSGRVMLIDFGIARSIGQKEEKGVTAVGTMGYAPPELFSGNVEPRSDIYSLGSTMFHLLTGADPQSNPLLIFDFQKNPRPRQINPQLSDQIERFLMRTVEYNAQARFGSAAEVKRFLEEHLENLKKGNLTYGIKEIPASVSLANQAVFCGFCGQKIVATDLFCAFCGAKQPIAQQGVHSEIYAHPSMTARLLIMGTSELESPAFSLEKDDNLIGRRDPMSNIFPEVDLSKYDPQTKISRRHARIWREGNSFLVEDLGSSNGTVLMPALSDVMRLVPHQPHALTSGDQLKLGDTTLHFVIS